MCGAGALFGFFGFFWLPIYLCKAHVFLKFASTYLTAAGLLVCVCVCRREGGCGACVRASVCAANYKVAAVAAFAAVVGPTTLP